MKYEYEIAKVLNNFFTILEKKLFKTFAILSRSPRFPILPFLCTYFFIPCN